MPNELKAALSARDLGASPECGGTKLEVRGISKFYGHSVALHPSDLTLSTGEFVTLLGPSGSGKTTLLMMIAGLVEPSSGEVWINGKAATHLPPYERDIGMVFQNYALFPHMTISENVAFPLEMKKWAKDRISAAVTEILDLVKLSHLAERMPGQLSGGQQQRVALARSLVYQPSIVLMDEPLGALDRKLREHMQQEIRRLHRELEFTVLYVTHDQDEAMSLSDRVCLMNEARIEQIGAPEEIYNAPVSAFAANFIGESNILSVCVDEIADKHIFVEALNGARFRVQRTNGSPEIGQAAILALRPERCRILHRGETEENCIEGVVSDRIMLGAMTRIVIDTALGSIVVLQLSTDTPALKPKQPVTVAWNMRAGVVAVKSLGTVSTP